MRVTLPTALVVAALALAAPGTAATGDSCVPKAGADKGKRVTQKRASKVVNRYARETLRDCDGVEGMGVGAPGTTSPPDPKDKVFLVVVYLRDKASKPAETRSIAGVRIKYYVTGPFIPH